MDNSEISKLPILKNGDENALVSKVKALLRSQGQWTGSDSEVFGAKLEQAVKYFQSTHLGPDKKYLDHDGVIGPNTWWALYNPTGDGQKSNITPSSLDRYENLSDTRKKQLAELWSEHSKNVHEIPDGSNGGDGVEKYIVGYGNVPWCALFQSGVWKESNGDWPNGSREGHVQTWWRKAVAGGYGKKINSGYKPVPGDLLVYVFGGGTGHITAVVAVAENGHELNTIGGNEANRVKLGYRDVSQESSAAGYIVLHKDAGDFPKGLLSDAESDAMDQGSTR